MATEETFTESDLTLTLTEGDAEVRVGWRGRSTDRDPARFLTPLLSRVLARAQEGGRPAVLDFSALDYMNSSTFAPLVRMLAEAARGGGRVVLEYSQGRKWQALSFAALRAFETPDGRIALRAK